MNSPFQDLLPHFPKMGDVTIYTPLALPKIERYLTVVLGIYLMKAHQVQLIKSLNAYSHKIYGYLSDTRTDWMRLEITLEGTITLVQVNGTDGYSATLFVQNDRYAPMLSIDARKYTGGNKSVDRNSYACLQSARFAPGDTWYKRASDVFLMLLANDASQTQRFKQLVTVAAFRK
ncbi:hypothetical protein KBA63_01610 [Candidatus Woesebacteria bacterium]|nr:hypothetical protein [Candidatus Woesebacteria bacterium]MBP9687149.1 hypothetical protein [Candidatus Woesebacteria bacterium]